jgi:hypothetical protein
MNRKLKVITTISASLLVMSVSFFSQGANAATTTVEIPVEALFAPLQGFDDNDNVQVVLHGTLPNSCYSLGEYKVEKTAGSDKVRIRQFAYKKKDGYCAEGQSIPDHLAMSIPFTTEVPIGQLPAGNYEINYFQRGETPGSARRSLGVIRATTPNVDNLPYAAVSNIASPDVFNGAENVSVKLNGVLNSSCTHLEDKVLVTQEDDVFVIRPQVRVDQGVYCMQVLIPFELNLNLGKAKPGHYLVHVRSMNGKSVNRVV